MCPALCGTYMDIRLDLYGLYMDLCSPAGNIGGILGLNVDRQADKLAKRW